MTDASSAFNPAPALRALLWRRAAWLLVPTIGLVLLWQWTPLKAVVQPQAVADFVGAARHGWWATPVIIVVSAVGCLLMVPLTLVVLAHGAIFSFPMSLLTATTSMLLAALGLFFLGRRAGEGVVDRVLPDELRTRLRNPSAKGVLGLAVMRWVPVAHFGLLSMALGALGVPVMRFMLSTLLGQTPVLALWVVLGDRIQAGLADPNLRTVGFFGIAVIVALVAVVLLPWIAKHRGTMPGRPEGPVA